MATQVQRWIATDGKEFHSECEADAHDKATTCIRVVPRVSGATENAAVYNALFFLFKQGMIEKKLPKI